MAGIINNSANPINSAKLKKLKKPNQPDQPEDEAVVKDIAGLQGLTPSPLKSEGFLNLLFLQKMKFFSFLS
jgi:hypothetical protein